MKSIRHGFVPELERLADPNDRSRLFRRAASDGSITFLYAIVLIIWLIVYTTVDRVVSRLIPTRSWLGQVYSIGNAVTPGVSFWIILLLLRARVRRFVRKELARLGLPTCIACGYDLTGDASGICPECGVPVAAREAGKNAGASK